MLNSTEASSSMPDISTTSTSATPVVALIIAIVGMVSNLFLHYKVKHIEFGCIKSDCQQDKRRESPPDSPVAPSTPPPKQKHQHHVRFPEDDVDELQLKALSDLEV